MKKLLFVFLTLSAFITAQDLPRGFAPGEEALMPAYLESVMMPASKAMITSPPNLPKLRNSAEWEEIQTLTITWTSYTSIHREIVRHAQQECKVTIICSDSNSVKSFLASGSPPVPATNLRFVIAPFNSIWIRDYFANTVYGNEVDSLILVDWIYNRPRPSDNVLPVAVANNMGIPIYETTQSPNDLIHTGGNYMSDGFGTAFSSALTDQENPSKTGAQIDTIMKKYMGINRYIRFPVLPYDGIHHIDMHMKLLDEETLLVGQYPTGVSDGPQIEANLQYILSNYNSVFGTPYKVVRIPMPPDKYNKYPSAGGWYCTYTNGVFVNKTFIFPNYYAQYDTTAFRIYKESLPGYKIIGIDCDNGTSPIISQSGAIHCITHSIGVQNPLLISHQPLSNRCDTVNPYNLQATIMHRSGIANATVYWTTDTLQPYTAASMTLTNPLNHTYGATIPAQQNNTTVYYYIEAGSVSGKSIRRPITAPQGRYSFKISCQQTPVGLAENKTFEMQPVFPNPASAITCIPFEFSRQGSFKLVLRNAIGQEVEVIHDGVVNSGKQNFFLFADKYPQGAYFIEARYSGGTKVQKLMIR